MSLEILLNLGFREVASCSLDNEELKVEIIDSRRERKILYAFVSNGIVKYLGVTSKTFENRMYGYAKPGSGQKTNIRVNKKLKELLLAGNTATIYLFTDPDTIQYRGININLAAGLEDNLIEHIAHSHNANNYEPLWNIRSNRFLGLQPLELIAAQEQELLEEELTYPEVDHVTTEHYPITFPVNLTPTSKDQGFVYLGASAKRFLAEANAAITVELAGDRPTSISSKITADFGPRVHLGNPFKEWLRNHQAENTQLQVQILNRHHIQLNWYNIPNN